MPKNWEEPLMLQLIDSSIHCVIRRSRKKHFEVSFSFVTSPTFLKVEEKMRNFLATLPTYGIFMIYIKSLPFKMKFFVAHILELTIDTHFLCSSCPSSCLHFTKKHVGQVQAWHSKVFPWYKKRL